MKNKNIKLTFLLLGGLIISSFAFFVSAQQNSNTNNNVFLDSDQDGLSDQEEKAYGTDPYNADTDSDSYSDGTEIKTGYDPLKPAPGDKIIKEESPIAKPATVSNQENLTTKISSQVAAVIDNPTGDKAVTIDEVQGILDNALNPQDTEVVLPEISKDDFKIIKQDYKKLSAEKRKEKMKEDFISYATALSYIFSTNSPKPITSSSDLTSVLNYFGQQIVSAISTRNPAVLKSLSQSGERMLEQMKEVEVPEDLVDLHIKGTQFAKYAMQLQTSLAPNEEDPFTDILNLSRVQSLVSVTENFAFELGSKLTEYGFSLDEPLVPATDSTTTSAAE